MGKSLCSRLKFFLGNFMKYSLVIISGLLIASSLSAKFSGIPVRADPPREREEEKPLRVEDPTPDIITPNLVRLLINAQRIDEPLRAREEENLNQLARLFRKLSERSDYEAAELSEIVYRSQLSSVTKINLIAALFLGKVDSERSLSADDIDALRKVSDRAELFTWDIRRELIRAIKLAYPKTPRSLLDDLQSLRAAIEDNRSRDR
jgi:hypothetical protein